MEDILVLDVSQELNSPYLASMAVASPDGFPASRHVPNCGLFSHALTAEGFNTRSRLALAPAKEHL